MWNWGAQAKRHLNPPERANGRRTREDVMSFSARPAMLASAIVLAFTVSASAAMSDEETIKNAMSAAPEAVGMASTVLNWDMKELQKGTNGWTCLPDVSRSDVRVAHRRGGTGGAPRGDGAPVPAADAAQCLSCL